MELLVKAGENVIDWPRLQKLNKGEEYPFWRGRGCPQDILEGDRVYFYKGGYIVGYCTYSKCESPENPFDQDGNRHDGEAIHVRGPFQPLVKPLAIDIPGRWPFRYLAYLPEIEAELKTVE